MLLIIYVEILLDVQNSASKLLLAIMESRHDSENAKHILSRIDIEKLVSLHFSVIVYYTVLLFFLCLIRLN